MRYKTGNISFCTAATVANAIYLIRLHIDSNDNDISK